MKEPVQVLLVSDATAMQSVGLTPRRFRELIRELGIPHARAGRRMLVRADLLLAAVDKIAGVPACTAAGYDEAALLARASRPREPAPAGGRGAAHERGRAK